MPSSFQPEALTFLRGLARHNDRVWFEARREVYERALKQPMLALIEEVNAAMVEFTPDHLRAPNKTMLRIHRDTRFSKNKLPYKKHIAAWFGRRGAVRTTGPGFYLHISPTEVQIAMGVFMPLPEQMLALRRWQAEQYEDYRALLKRIMRARKGELPLQPVDAQPLTRMPKGWPADHPAGELLRARRWGAAVSLPSAAALETDFSKQVIRYMRAGAPLIQVLDEAISGSNAGVAAKRLRPMF